MDKRPTEELYDIVKDPACLLNLADRKEYRKEIKRLSVVLDKYVTRTEDPRALTGESGWDHFPYYYENFEGVVPYSDIKQTE
jgi:hypothetical protein